MINSWGKTIPVFGLVFFFLRVLLMPIPLTLTTRRAERSGSEHMTCLMFLFTTTLSKLKQVLTCINTVWASFSRDHDCSFQWPICMQILFMRCTLYGNLVSGVMKTESSIQEPHSSRARCIILYRQPKSWLYSAQLSSKHYYSVPFGLEPKKTCNIDKTSVLTAIYQKLAPLLRQSWANIFIVHT